MQSSFIDRKIGGGFKGIRRRIFVKVASMRMRLGLKTLISSPTVGKKKKKEKRHRPGGGV